MSTHSNAVGATGSSARRQRSDATRNEQRVLLAAREVYAEQGLGAGFDVIARRAGVGVGTVYRRFPDREALVGALFEDRFDAVNALAAASRESIDPWSGFVDFVTESVRMFAEDRGLREVVFDSAGGTHGNLDTRDRLAPLLAEVVHRAHVAAVLRADFTPDDLANVIAMLSGLHGATERGWSGNEGWLRCARFVLDGLAAPVRGASTR